RFAERGQRRLSDAKFAQAIPGEGHRHPALVFFDRSHDFRGRLRLFTNRRQPGPSARGVAKRKKFISSRERGRPSQQDVLDVFVFKHNASCSHCIWSSMSEKAALTLSAFLISSELT